MKHCINCGNRYDNQQEKAKCSQCEATILEEPLLILCPHCQSKHLAHVQFCPSKGKPLAQCPDCKRIIDESWKFCYYCGFRLPSKKPETVSRIPAVATLMFLLLSIVAIAIVASRFYMFSQVEQPTKEADELTPTPTHTPTNTPLSTEIPTPIHIPSPTPSKSVLVIKNESSVSIEIEIEIYGVPKAYSVSAGAQIRNNDFPTGEYKWKISGNGCTESNPPTLKVSGDTIILITKSDYGCGFIFDTTP